MLKLLLFSLTTLLVVSAQAEPWFDFDYRGTCTGPEQEGVVPVLHLYSEVLDSTKPVDGLVTIEGHQKGEVEHVGAMKATYAVDANYDSVAITIRDQTLVIPFGEDVQVTAPDGAVLTCSVQD